ncbi:MAG: hypothetical protein KKB50_00645 [Planctomycetes bacterium]|nr:hypothetical protein [Planctomycetota bacterium]
MFVLLAHDTRETATETPASPGQVHWDFLVEVGGRPLLATWRLALSPVAETGAIVAERAPDHQPAFLDYEGELHRAKGRVRRVDRGAAQVRTRSAERLLVELHGAHLRGSYEICPAGGGGLVFRPVKDPGDR